jgi:hypothetical protein
MKIAVKPIRDSCSLERIQTFLRDFNTGVKEQAENNFRFFKTNGG